MEIHKTLKNLQTKINRRLDDFFREKLKEQRKISPLAAEMTEKIRDFTLKGGKRLRPILVYWGYLAGGGKNKKAILDASIFVELLHSYLLIHDDIIDRDEKRRGGPTVHKSYEEKYKKISKESGHLGISAAIMAGDLACAFAYEILADSKFPPVLRQKAIKKINQVFKDVIYGETMDIFSGLSGALKKADIFKILEYKTARYTIEGPLHIGAILSGAPDKILRTISQYAIPLGIAFQLKDDILGLFGDEKITGKSASSDIKEGKMTLLISETLRRADAGQRKEILKVFGNQKAGDKQIKKVKEIIVKTGALNYVAGQANELALEAGVAVKRSGLSFEVKKFLIGLVNFILARAK